MTRPLGGSHRGLASFLIQRLTSLYLGGFVVYVIVYLLVHPLKSYGAWSGYFSSGAVRLAWGIFIGNVLAHAWVGLRSIYMDYVKPTWLRFVVSSATALGLIAAAFWAAMILARGIT